RGTWPACLRSRAASQSAPPDGGAPHDMEGVVRSPQLGGYSHPTGSISRAEGLSNPRRPSRLSTRVRDARSPTVAQQQIAATGSTRGPSAPGTPGATRLPGVGGLQLRGPWPLRAYFLVLVALFVVTAGSAVIYVSVQAERDAHRAAKRNATFA